MTEEMQTFHVITPGILAAILAHAGDGPKIVEAMIPGRTVHCDGVVVGRAIEGPKFELACDDPRHGVHPRYRDAMSRVAALLAKLPHTPATTRDPICPKCWGTGFLAVDVGTQTALMALTFRIFKGVELPTGVELLGQEGTLPAPTLGDSLSAILPRPATVDCPSAAPAAFQDNPTTGTADAAAPPTQQGGNDGNDQAGE